ncbi:unnamed protein product [Paramecium primaurelia]|uniref:Tetratricopeptide repeat protein n=1 Tax=Paramecium primaurelia TaxID=5886 RepID=A0A8S1KKA1_PARPR|nr:unnamed protein product [Paramecium primaurelia]
MSFQESKYQQEQNQNYLQAEELYSASQVKLKDQKIQEALKLINDALILYPQNSKALALRGQLFLKNYLYDQALEDLNQAVQLEPQNEEILYYRATVFFRKRMLIEALTDCENAIKINPKYAMPYMRIGSIKAAMGNQDEALQYYNKAIEVDENCCSAYINRGVLSDEMGNKEQALFDYNKAIELDPNDAKSYCNRGILQKELGKIDQALLDYNKAIQLDPNDANSYNTRGALYKQIGNKQQALLDYNKAIELDSTDSNVYNNRGNLYKENNQNDLAVSDYLQALNFQSDNPLILANLGDLYYSEQNYILSADYYKQALASLDLITPQKQINWSLSEGNILFIKEKIKVLLEIQNDIAQLRQQLSTITTKFDSDQQSVFEVQENISNIERKLTKQLKPFTESTIQEENQQQLNFLLLAQEDLKQLQQKVAQLHQIINEQNDRINHLEEDNQKLKQQDGYQIQESMIILQKAENKHQFIYYKALFWKLYYYLSAMQQISSELYQMNRDAMIESKSEKVLDIVQKVFNVGSKVVGVIPIGGEAFDLINEALDYAIEQKKENKFKVRLHKLTNILKCFNIISPVDLENEVKIAAIELAKKQQLDLEGKNNKQFEEFVNKLSKSEILEDENNMYWKNGTNDALVILKYLEDYSSTIIETYDKKIREIFIDAVEKNNKTQTQILQQQNPTSISQVVTVSRCCLIQ